MLEMQASENMPPLPPLDLMLRVVPPVSADLGDVVKDAFHSEAWRSVEAVELALATLGKQLEDFEHVLDFGCGPARVMRHLGGLPESVKLYGVDIDADMIEWCSSNIDFAEFAVGPHEPPMPYDDETFDLVFNHSVFTHIDERFQDLWLAEIRRVLKPGGIALLSVHSTRQWNQAAHDIAGGGEDIDKYREILERDGILFISDDHFIGTTHPSWYHTTFHAPWYVYEHWSNFFTVRAHIHEGSVTQDMIVLQRPAEEGDTLLAPIGHRSAEPVTTDAGTQAESSVSKRASRSGGKRGKAELQQQVDQLAEQQAQLVAQVENQAESNRTLTMMHYSLSQQAERISLLERELRRELTQLQESR